MFKKNAWRTLFKSIILWMVVAAIHLDAASQNGYSKVKLADYYRQQDYEEAIRYLKAVEGQNEGVLAFNTDIGYALFMNEQYDDAKMYFQKGFLLEPENFESTLYLAQLGAIGNNPDTSLFYYGILIKNYPGNYRFWQRAGGLNYQLGNLDTAVYYYSHAYMLNNRSGRIAVSLANMLLRTKKTDEADSLISSFLTRDSSDEDVIAKKIEISFKKASYDTVIRWGQKLWRDSSQLAAPFVSLAYSYLNKQYYPICLQLCDWLEFTKRSNESILYCEALALAKIKRYDESNLKLDECIHMSIQEAARIYLTAKADNYENMQRFVNSAHYYDTAWYIFHKPYDLYFAGRIYDNFLKNPAKAGYYYRLFQKNKPAPGNSGELRVIEYIDGWLREKQKAPKK